MVGCVAGGEAKQEFSYYTFEEAERIVKLIKRNYKGDQYVVDPLYAESLDETRHPEDMRTVWARGRWPSLPPPTADAAEGVMDLREGMKKPEFKLENLHLNTLQNRRWRRHVAFQQDLQTMTELAGNISLLAEGEGTAIRRAKLTAQLNDAKERINANIPTLNFDKFFGATAGYNGNIVVRMQVTNRFYPFNVTLECLSRVVNIASALLFISIDGESVEMLRFLMEKLTFAPAIIMYHPRDYESSPFAEQSRALGKNVNLHNMWQAVVIYDVLQFPYGVYLEDDLCVGPDFYDYHNSLKWLTLPEGGERFKHIALSNQGSLYFVTNIMFDLLRGAWGMTIDRMDLLTEEWLYHCWGLGSPRKRYVELFMSMQVDDWRMRWDMQLLHLTNGTVLAPVVSRCYITPNAGTTAKVNEAMDKELGRPLTKAAQENAHGTEWLHRFPMSYAIQHNHYLVMNAYPKPSAKIVVGKREYSRLL